MNEPLVRALAEALVDGLCEVVDGISLVSEAKHNGVGYFHDQHERVRARDAKTIAHRAAAHPAMALWLAVIEAAQSWKAADDAIHHHRNLPLGSGNIPTVMMIARRVATTSLRAAL